jgi:hypothetical protein
VVAALRGKDIRVRPSQATIVIADASDNALDKGSALRDVLKLLPAVPADGRGVTLDITMGRHRHHDSSRDGVTFKHLCMDGVYPQVTGVILRKVSAGHTGHTDASVQHGELVPAGARGPNPDHCDGAIPAQV